MLRLHYLQSPGCVSVVLVGKSYSSLARNDMSRLNILGKTLWERPTLSNDCMLGNNYYLYM